MNLTFLAFGTRGDVQPVVALGMTLARRGHRVRMVASPNFKGWIAGHGLEAVASRVDIQALMRGAEGAEWVEHGNNPVRQMRVMKKLLDQHARTMMEDSWAACQDAEAVFSSFTSDVYAASIAEKLGVKHISTPLQPALVPTRSGWAMTNASLPHRTSPINYLFSKLLIEPFGWRLMGRQVNRFRMETLDLPPQRYPQHRQAMRRTLVVLGYSPQVVPHPPDWPANIRTAGYWFLDEELDWRPSKDLLDFLEAGDPPVYIGFGSMAGPDPGRLTETLIETAARSGERAVLQSGWAGIGVADLPPSVHLLETAPHRWLFPRMLAVVHHGGAGTTAEGLRAGVPAVIVPHLADQPFWGRRLADLGVSPEPIPRGRLTAENLSQAIRRAVEDPMMRQRAAELGEKLRAEDGIGTAVKIIEGFICG